MGKILETILLETNGKSYKTAKHEIDLTDNYFVTSEKITWKKYAESPHKEHSIYLKTLADDCLKKLESPFVYFLDGSRHVFKIDDVLYLDKIYPITAGQICVACCERKNRKIYPLNYKNKNGLKYDIVIALPKVAGKSDWIENDDEFEELCKKLNSYRDYNNYSKKVQFSKILSYPKNGINFKDSDKFETMSISVIQDFMIEQEKNLVADLADNNLLSNDKMLLKDGSIEYPITSKSSKELRKFKENYRYALGISKSFNLENYVDKHNKNNSDKIAELPLYHRTPVSLYHSDRVGDLNFAVWFVRIRETRYTNSVFSGILKIEKILVTDSENEKGLDSEEVNFLTANIINERNPVCYGNDSRWANHLYPIYLTEQYIKSKFISSELFMNLF